MANENRIRIMTAIAVYEKRHREELANTERWFRGDYIGVRMLKNGCRLTLAFLVGAAFGAVINFDELMNQLNSMDIMDTAVSLLIWYCVCLCTYLVATYAVYSVRYYHAEKRRRTYIKLVDRLEAEYKKELRIPSRRRRRGGLNRSR